MVSSGTCSMGGRYEHVGTFTNVSLRWRRYVSPPRSTANGYSQIHSYMMETILRELAVLKKCM